MSRLIIAAEYDGFLRHVFWNEFNRMGLSKNCISGYDQIMEMIESNANSALRNVDCRLIKIPVEMEHGEFKKQMVAIILNQ